MLDGLARHKKEMEEEMKKLKREKELKAKEKELLKEKSQLMDTSEKLKAERREKMITAFRAKKAAEMKQKGQFNFEYR